jgi:Protein of unknown function (DUF3717)
MKTMLKITIEQIERAINIWRARFPSTEERPFLCAPARALADVYGLMIIDHQNEIDRVSLNAAQVEAFDGAFSALTA